MVQENEEGQELQGVQVRMINLRAKDLMILPPLENNDGKARSVKKAL